MYWLVAATVGSGANTQTVRARISPQQRIPKPGDTAWFEIVGPHTCYYRGEQLIEEAIKESAP